MIGLVTEVLLQEKVVPPFPLLRRVLQLMQESNITPRLRVISVTGTHSLVIYSEGNVALGEV